MTRVGVGALVVTASLLVGVGTHEGWLGVARPPVKNDVPTGGYGSTTNEQGKPFREGDKIDPVRGLALLGRDLEAHAQIVRSCVHVPLHQYEFDAFTSLAYNIGHGRKGKDGFCINKSGQVAIIPRKLATGDYAGACKAILLYVHFNGQRLPGLERRRSDEYRQCMGG